MKDQILKLCKRLKRCTLEDIVQFTELEEKQILPVIYYLLDNDYLEDRDGIYTPKINTEPVHNTNNFYLKKQYHSDEEIDTILKGFCLNLPASKIKYFLSCKESSISDFYQLFRQKIYERQLKELLNHYFNRPQNNHYRVFFEKFAFFYCYNKKIYVTDKPLRAPFEDLKTRAELREFRKVYCYINRVIENRNREKYLYHHLAENIWRRNKSFEEMYSDIKNLLNT